MAAAIAALIDVKSMSPAAAKREALSRFGAIERRGSNLEAGIACLLHTEAAFWLYDHDEVQGGRDQLKIAEVLHKEFAYRPKDRDRRDGFYQSWLLLVGMFLHSRGQFETAELYLSNGLRTFPANPEFLLEIAALHETWANRAADGPDAVNAARVARANHLADAEGYLRRALKADPESPETTLRLAKIRWSRKQPQEARWRGHVKLGRRRYTARRHSQGRERSLRSRSKP